MTMSAQWIDFLVIIKLLDSPLGYVNQQILNAKKTVCLLILAWQGEMSLVNDWKQFQFNINYRHQPSEY